MCPSSTFSSKSNLKKHQFTRHQGGGSSAEGGPNEGGSSADDEDEEFDYDIDVDTDDVTNGHEIDEGILNGEARFRCHLCQHPVQVFSERVSALDHLRLKHGPEYEELRLGGQVSKAEGCSVLNVNNDKSISCLFCSLNFDAQHDLQNHVKLGHGTDSAKLSPFPPKIVTAQDDKNQVKRKRANLMDKINQLTSSAVANASMTSIFAKNIEEANIEKEIIVNTK
jgi:hypothetical protein